MDTGKTLFAQLMIAQDFVCRSTRRGRRILWRTGVVIHTPDGITSDLAAVFCSLVEWLCKAKTMTPATRATANKRLARARVTNEMFGLRGRVAQQATLNPARTAPRPFPPARRVATQPHRPLRAPDTADGSNWP